MFLTLTALALGQLPITDVTVFSDRARVTRSGTLNVSGRQRVELATLVDTAEPRSIVVDASGAKLEAVDLLPLDEEQLPVGDAKALVKQLEENADALAKLNAELSALNSQAASLQALSPSVPSAGANQPPPKLSSSGWAAAVSFSSDLLGKLQARERDLTVKAQDLYDKRQELEAKAAQLGGAPRKSGWKVVATAKGSGPSKFALTYVALRARWVPTYDVQLQPDTGKVQVSFAGLVSQETGEDWADAALTLSTAIPSQSNELPKLLTWKIGQRERFIPTPTPVLEQVRPPPVAPALEPKQREADQLRNELANRVVEDKKQLEEGVKTRALETDRRRYQDFGAKNKPAAPPPPPAPQGYAAGAPAPAAAADRDSDGIPDSVDLLKEEEVSVTSISGKRGGKDHTRTSEMSLSPPRAYVRPFFSPELPAMAGGGYDLAWPSLQRESVQSGKGARRVALFSQSWPVTTERKLYPALFAESFLVAELKNPAAWPLPAGAANLFVGADPAGTAQLKLVSPNETFTLPLGIDRALKPQRNVKVVDAEKGVFSKDDYSEYTVRTQVANPYRTPLSVRIYDQIPTTDDKEVEIALIESKPSATLNRVRGHLEWRLSIPAGGKTEVSFRYSLKRPKGWRMNQWEVQQ